MKEERRKDMSKGKWCFNKLGFKFSKKNQAREKRVIIMKERERMGGAHNVAGHVAGLPT